MNMTELDAIRDFVWERLDKTDIENFEWIGDEGDADDYASSYLREAKYDMKADDFDYGCSKSVFYFDELKDYVVKIPFRGYCGYDYDEDEDCYSDDSYWYEEFSNGGSERVWDYCETEAYMFQEAEKYGVDKFLCGTWFLGMYDGYPIYVSERAITCYYNKPEKEYCYKGSRDDSMRQASDLNRHYGYFPEKVLSMMIDAQGIEKVYDLMEFIKNKGINDFHNGNFMYAADGTIRLIDYSGYED